MSEEPLSLDDMDEAQIAGWLSRNPDFLLRHPQLLAAMTPPSRFAGAGSVVDLQFHMLEQMKGEVDKLRDCARELIATTRTNMAGQTRVHAAALALLAATSFEQIGRAIAEELPSLLDVEVVMLAFEPPGLAPIDRLPSGVIASVFQTLPIGTVGRLLGARDALLRPDVEGDPALFGGAAGVVRSDALVRLKAAGRMPEGLMLFGGRYENAFHPAQGSELIRFLAQITGHCVRRCLETKS